MFAPSFSINAGKMFSFIEIDSSLAAFAILVTLYPNMHRILVFFSSRKWTVMWGIPAFHHAMCTHFVFFSVDAFCRFHTGCPMFPLPSWVCSVPSNACNYWRKWAKGKAFTAFGMSLSAAPALCPCVISPVKGTGPAFTGARCHNGSFMISVMKLSSDARRKHMDS